jgi:hypothetical protein
VIPLSSSRARICLCSIKNEFKQFTEFIKRFPPSNLHAATETIPTKMHNRTYDTGHMNTGDATGLSKPTSGEGILYQRTFSLPCDAVHSLPSSSVNQVTISIPSFLRTKNVGMHTSAEDLNLDSRCSPFHCSFATYMNDTVIDATNTSKTLALIKK